MITGDNGLTAAAIARRVGIAGERPTIVTGTELDELSEPELDHLLRERDELIFARSSPEAKLRIADALRAEGHVVAMTFAHTTPEVTPLLVFALAGGAIPLPLTVMQLLAFDVGTETLPALALGRERAEPGIMRRPPRARSESVIRRGCWCAPGCSSG